MGGCGESVCVRACECVCMCTCACACARVHVRTDTDSLCCVAGLPEQSAHHYLFGIPQLGLLPLAGSLNSEMTRGAETLFQPLPHRPQGNTPFHNTAFFLRSPQAPRGVSSG